jgi:hypothetical protein
MEKHDFLRVELWGSPSGYTADGGVASRAGNFQREDGIPGAIDDNEGYVGLPSI